MAFFPRKKNNVTEDRQAIVGDSLSNRSFRWVLLIHPYQQNTISCFGLHYEGRAENFQLNYARGKCAMMLKTRIGIHFDSNDEDGRTFYPIFKYMMPVKT